MTIEKNHNGAYIITDIINGYLFKRVYIFYSKREAVKRFKQELKAENKASI